MFLNQYAKHLLGANAQVLVNKTLAYTTDATLAAFVANAPEGELGVFNDDATKSLVSDLAAVAVTAPIFIAIKRDGFVETSVVFKRQDVKISYQAYEAPVKQVTTLDITGSAPATGDILGVRVVETTPGNQPFPTWYWEHTVTAGQTLVQAVTALVAKINSTSSVENQDRDLIVDAAVAATDNITLTAKNFGVSFRVQVNTKLAERTTITYTTPMKIGSGYSSMVQLLQEHGDTYKGYTTMYPVQGERPEDYGKPTDFVVAGSQYNLYTITGIRQEDSKTPHRVWNFKHNIILAITGDPNTSLQTILGF